MDLTACSGPATVSSQKQICEDAHAGHWRRDGQHVPTPTTSSGLVSSHLPIESAGPARYPGPGSRNCGATRERETRGAAGARRSAPRLPSRASYAEGPGRVGVVRSTIVVFAYQGRGVRAFIDHPIILDHPRQLQRPTYVFLDDGWPDPGANAARDAADGVFGDYGSRRLEKPCKILVVQPQEAQM